MQHTGTLYLIPTLLAENTYEQALPLGHKTLIDQINYFLVEDMRSARRFLSGYKIAKPIHELIFFELNKDTKQEQLVSYFAEIPSDAHVGVLSEAGCPGVADPGALAVAYAHSKGMPVKPLVGPSSILLALMGSGFSGQSFVFHGYLSIDKAERIKQIKAMEQEAKQLRRTQIFMETPYRNNGLLSDILQQAGNNTLLSIASDIASPNEFIKTQRIEDWRKQIPDLHKKPTIFLLFA